MIFHGDAREHLQALPEASIDLSFWSPPYYVGKSYEADLSFDCWQTLLREVIAAHPRILRPGGFMAVNIADILCFPTLTCRASKPTTSPARPAP